VTRRHQTASLLISGRPALPPEPKPHIHIQSAVKIVSIQLNSAALRGALKQTDVFSRDKHFVMSFYPPFFKQVHTDGPAYVKSCSVELILSLERSKCCAVKRGFLCVSFQVCLYFYNKLYRGNRVTKVDARSFNAFSSPNLAPLAVAEVDITSKPAVSRVCLHVGK